MRPRCGGPSEYVSHVCDGVRRPEIQPRYSRDAAEMRRTERVCVTRVRRCEKAGGGEIDFDQLARDLAVGGAIPK